MAKIIYICSLSHSGSTLLDLLIGGNPSCVSMGEIFSALKRRAEPQKECTCGVSALDCPVWSRVLPHVHDDMPYSRQYDLVVSAVEATYGQDVHIIDSSKSVATLERLSDGGQHSIRAILLVKDVRAFVVSQVARAARGDGKRRVGWRGVMQGSRAYNALSWYRGTRRMEQFLAASSIEFFQIGYEELCLRPRDMMSQISEFLGIDFAAGMLVPGAGTSHIIRGNRMRYEPAKLRSVSYDYRWLRGGAALSLVTLPLMGYNRKTVYRNSSIPSPKWV
jgi:hypothetical protein